MQEEKNIANRTTSPGNNVLAAEKWTDYVSKKKKEEKLNKTKMKQKQKKEYEGKRYKVWKKKWMKEKENMRKDL